MSVDLWPRLISAGILVLLVFRARKRKDRRAMIDALLIGVLWVALLIPGQLPVVRYGMFGAALAILLARLVKFDLINATDKYARAMTVGMLVFVASVIPVLSMTSPVPAWAKYLAMCGTISMMATLLWPLLWMSRILFSAHRLSRDLKNKRPPREADEKALGIDLSVLRQPRD